MTPRTPAASGLERWYWEPPCPDAGDDNNDADDEDGDLSSFVLEAMLENYAAAKEDSRAMCGDTGCPRWYVKMGNEARIDGGPIALETALRRATANATQSVPLRPNRVHPLWRTDHDNNVGIVISSTIAITIVIISTLFVIVVNMFQASSYT